MTEDNQTTFEISWYDLLDIVETCQGWGEPNVVTKATLFTEDLCGNGDTVFEVSIREKRI